MEAPSNSTIVWRGVRRRCGRCGTRAPFRGWFRLSERCRRCGYQFAREEGFMTGVYLINYSIVAAVLVAVIMVYLAVLVVSGEGVALWPYMLVGAALAVIVPLAAYPFAVTTWAAIDLAMRPLEPVEEAEAAVNADEDWEGFTRSPESPA